jgi:hypothetical protein
MKERLSRWLRIVATVALAAGSAQRAQAQQPGGGSAAPPAAVGQDNSTLGTTENPPLSGLDQPSLEPGATARNFLQPALRVSQAVDSNVGNDLGDAAVHGVTRVLGSLLLKRLWRRYETDLAYVGGGALYTGFNKTGRMLQGLEGQQRISWRTGQLAVRDSLSYLPEGSFGAVGAWGMSGLGGSSLGGSIPGIFSSGQAGTLGQVPRLTNVALAEVVESLSPRSALTATGEYGLVHFYDNSVGFVGSTTATAQAAYNYQINRKDQVALAYAYQDFQFPRVPSSRLGCQLSTCFVRTQITSLMYGHRISGRMNFLISAGPQLTRIHSPLFSTNRLTVYGHVVLHYRFPRTTVLLSYSRRNTNGSGFSLGAASDIARLSAARPLNRRWEITGDMGFARNATLIPATVDGVTANRYDYLFAGAGVHRQLGRYFEASLNYQFSDLVFNSKSCNTSGTASRSCLSQRHVAIFGLTWHPRPIRLD